MALSQRRSALVRRLHRRKTRVREGAVLVEGVRAVREVLAAGVEPRFVVTAAGLSSTPDGLRLLDQISSEGFDRTEVSDRELAELAATETPQGVLLVCDQPRVTLADAGLGPLLLLDAVQDPGNVGTLIRSAAAFGFTGVIVCDGSADPWGAKVVRASAGSAFRLPVVGCDLTEAVDTLRARSVEIWAAAADGVRVEALLGDRSDARGLCLAVGNEGRGVRDRLREAAHTIVKVEMKGAVESLNAGVAGSILMHAMTSGSEGSS